MNPQECIAPDGVVIRHRSARRLLKLIERDVERRTAKQLHELLVTDAVKRRLTDLRWAVAAYARIGEQTGKGAEQAFTDVVDEVAALTGLRAMPIA